jgi:short subunit dehydrogenase-like uncharacterized protein
MQALDLMVFGATGFTGQRVVRHLLERSAAPSGEPSVRWGMAGRDLAKLEAVRVRLGAPDGVPLVRADIGDPASLKAMVRATRVVLTTVGPYTHYGEPLVVACVEAGTDYVDLCGEPAWMARMIEKYGARARDTGARILFSCGFDSVPFDLGVVFAQEEAAVRLGEPLVAVHGRVHRVRGSLSGGTLASLMASVDGARADAQVRQLMGNPFALTPGFRGAQQPRLRRPTRDPWSPDRREWMTPFLMAGINTKSVHRTQFLRGHPGGEAFQYDEMQRTGPGVSGMLQAWGIHLGLRVFITLLALAPTRAILQRFLLPAPGQGPESQEGAGAGAGAGGFYDLRFHGETAGRRTIAVRVGADEDPGYRSTGRMIAECAILLARDAEAGGAPGARPRVPGGIWTPGAALGMDLVAVLQGHAKIRFEVLDEPAAGRRPQTP